jgi:hypothetical protein
MTMSTGKKKKDRTDKEENSQFVYLQVGFASSKSQLLPGESAYMMSADKEKEDSLDKEAKQCSTTHRLVGAPRRPSCLRWRAAYMIMNAKGEERYIR